MLRIFSKFSTSFKSSKGYNQNLYMKTNLVKEINRKMCTNEKIRVVNESNLKGYINTFRKKSHKYSHVNPLKNKKDIKLSSEFDPSFWGIGKTEKLEEFPIDNSHVFNKNLLESAFDCIRS